MSYRPEGASLPAKFKKANTNANTSKQRPKDRLCVVEAYNTSDKTVIAVEVDTGRKIEAKINPDKASTGLRSSADKWNGNLIDERMEGAIPAGSRFVLEGCETERNIKKPGGDISLMRCSWVSSIPDQNPEKSGTGIISVNAYNDRVVGVQVWERKAINPQSEEGEAEIGRLGEEMDKVLAAYRADERPVALGAQFRTLVQVDTDREGKPMYEMVDNSPPFDWISAKKDGEGNVIEPGHPLDRAHLEMYLEGYLDYVYGSQDQSIPDAEPGLVASGLIPEGKEIIVEVLSYKAYQASTLSKNMELRNEKTPLYRLANVMTKNGQMDQSGFQGKNWAVDGIYVLTGDQAPKNRGDAWRARNLITRVYTNGYTNNVHALVTAFDGGRVRPHPALDRVRDNDGPGAPAAGVASTAAPSAPASSGVVLQAVTPVFEEEGDDAGAGYFAAALSSSVAPPTPEDEDEPAAAPAAPPAAEQAAAPADKADKKDKTSGTARFRRNT